MNAPTGFQPHLDFDAASEAAAEGQALIIDIDGYEGPLHVLLALARGQKVDLLKLSVTRLADQYLAFVQQARKLRFSLAADYLVMASWLAYLKSRLLLPKPDRPQAEEMPPEIVAAQLAFRLAKLDAMRRGSDQLRDGPQLGRDVFVRGDPEAIKIIPSTRLEGNLYGLMTAYITHRRKGSGQNYVPPVQRAYPLETARDRLRDLLGDLNRWTSLGGLAPQPAPTDQVEAEPGPTRASYVASTLSASLELVKEGALEARQAEAFAEIYLRARRGSLA